MNPDRWPTIKRIFSRAVALTTASRRREYLDQVCAGSASLRAEVERLLRHDRANEAPLELGRSLAGQTLGQYRLRRKIGAGGMGAVYRAKDTRLDREVAVKVLSPILADDPESRARFLQEARCASALNDPNAVIVHDVGTDHGLDFIVMEYIPGQALDRIIPRRGLPLAQALNYAQQIAHALAAAHRTGVVHHDLKPSNVRVTPEGRVKVLDFGLARRASPAGRRRAAPRVGGVPCGTIGYSSPEQLRRQRTDPRSDIFAFGAMLYEMLSGQRAFHGQSPEETAAAILVGTFPPLPRRIPRPIASLVERCLQKDPAARFQTMDALASALRGLSRSLDSGAPRRSGGLPVRKVALLAAGLIFLAVFVAIEGHRSPARWRVQVARLEGRDGDSWVTQSVFESLRQAAGSYPELDIQLLPHAVLSTADESAVLNEARRQHASLILWGETVPKPPGVEVTWRLGVAEELVGIPFHRRVAAMHTDVARFDHVGIARDVSRPVMDLAFLMAGVDRYRLKDPEGAIRLLTQALTEPSVPPSLVDPGVARYYRGLATEAAVDAGPCLKTAEGCDLAKTVDSLSREIADFDWILSGRPRHGDSLWHRGLAYSKLAVLQDRATERPAAVASWTHAIDDFGQAMEAHRSEQGFVGTLSDPTDVLWNRGLTRLLEARSGALDAGARDAQLTEAIQDFNHVLDGGPASAPFLERRRADVLRQRAAAQEEQRRATSPD